MAAYTDGRRRDSILGIITVILMVRSLQEASVAFPSMRTINKDLVAASEEMSEAAATVAPDVVAVLVGEANVA